MKRNLFVTLALLLISIGSVFAQQRTITGNVTSTFDGTPLPGVTVLVQEAKSIGTITDVNGNYSLKVPQNAQSLVFSFIGMETQQVQIGTSNQINVALTSTMESLEEFVVTALGIKREVKALGFAAQQVGEADLSASRETNITNYLAGKVAGVQVSKSGTGAGGSTNVVIRGKNSLGSGNQPLYVVDGFPILARSNENRSSGISSADIDYGDSPGDINPQDVESMNVLKGPAATALYGARGSNGVILITTKSGKHAKKGIGIEVNSGITFEELDLVPNFQNKFSSGYDDENYASSGNVTIDGVVYRRPDYGSLDSWGGPLDGSTMIPNWWTLPADGSIPTSVWDNPITELIPDVAQPIDNVRNFFNTGVTYSNTVAMTSSNDNSSMRLSLGNTSTKGIVPNH